MYTQRTKKVSQAMMSAILLVIFACGDPTSADSDPIEMGATKAFNFETNQHSLAVFAGGCFWCMEGPFEKLDGVIEVYSGYTGGSKKSPAYKEVASGSTNHIESVIVLYDESKITYEELLAVFWRNIDPTQDNGQFYDIGNQYRTVIFYMDDKQKEAAEKSKRELEQSAKFDKPIVTRLIHFKGPFWLAEDYHQDYYKKNPVHYNRYRVGSGRDAFIKKHWGDQN